MINDEFEYQCALEELKTIEGMLVEMLAEHRTYRPDLELLGVRRLAIRLHKELGEYESRYDRPLLDDDDSTKVRQQEATTEVRSQGLVDAHV